MSLEIRPVRGRGELKRFIFLPELIHQGHDRWVHPIYTDEWAYFSPKKNRAFGYCDTVLALAWRDGKPVGRVMGIVNRRYNERSGERVARFGFLETWEEPETVRALLGFVEDWARKLGMNRLVGPMGFSDQDPEGILVEGFDLEPTIATWCNFEWLPRLIEAAGYTKELDYVVYIIPVPQQMPDVYEKISRRVARLREFRLVEFPNTRSLKPYIHRVLGLMNDTFQHLYGYVPLDQEEMNELAKRYLPVIDTRFVKVVELGGDVVGFVLGIPNMNQGIRKARGRLFPFGILHILAAAKRSKQLDILLGAIRQDCRGRGLDVMMGAAMLRSAIAAGMQVMDSHHEMETNLAVRAEMERAGGKVGKVQRVYQKTL